MLWPSHLIWPDCCSLFSCFWLFATPWTAAHQASLYITISQSLLIHVHWVGDAIKPSHSLSSPSPPALKLSQHQVFSNESALHIRWPKYWSFSFSINPSNEYSRLISFRIDWLDLLAVQDSQESSPVFWRHQLFSAQPFFYCPALTFVHDYWKNQNFDDMNPCQQSNVSVF